ncbi:ankyrin repeat-containing domain protein [Mycena rosella]|uniref:Ankyrin repeat-containing domain protein n=1 Tax=Mycena rosella TaxID=1033263 RepID=A0AAD7CYR5_MYCRO|nr:ankyrin repeat-containing domain protein [Mycena rosella]
MELPSPPHAFSPRLAFFDEDSVFFDIWRGTGLEGTAYFAARNDSVPLIRASQTNDIAAVQNLISSPGLRIDESGLEGETALHMACALGYAEVAEALISAGASLDATDHEGVTPLVHCTRFCPPNDSARVVTILLAAGANPLHIVGLDLARYPPLWFAINAHNMSAVRILAPLTPLDFPSESYHRHITDAAIYSAATHSHANTEVLEFLIECGLPLEPRDLAKAAADDQTFELIVQALGLSNTQVAQLGHQILLNTWTLHRPYIVPCMKRLVEHYQLDLNEDTVLRLIVSSMSLELLRTSATLGLNLNSTTFDEARHWLPRSTSKDFEDLVREMCWQP